jgi:MFS family permease
MCLLLFSSLIAIGQIIFAIGLSMKSWPVIFLGRLVFGFGGESFTVANSALLADWFKGKELALAFGFNLSISKLGSVFNNMLSPILSDKISIIFALWFGAMLCGFGICCVLITIPIDRHLDNLIEKAEEQSGYKALTSIVHGEGDEQQVEVSLNASDMSSSSTGSKSHSSTPSKLPLIDGGAGGNDEDVATMKDVFKLKHIFWVLVVSCVVVYGCVLPFNNISSSLLLERDYFREPSSSCQLQNNYQCENSQTNPPVGCPTSEWFQPPLPYNYSIYNPLSIDDIDCTDDEWKDGCTSEYCSRLSKAETQTSFVMSIPYIISAALSPPVGFLVDQYGYRAVIAAVAPAILIIVHCYLGLTNVSAIGPLVGQGLAYTGFVSVLWPSIPLVVDSKVTGLAFGIVTSMQNLACAIMPLIIAAIYSDSDDKYIPNVEFLFISCAVIGLVVGLYLNYYDMNNGHVLNAATIEEDELVKLKKKGDYSIVSTGEEGDDGEDGSKGKGVLNPLIDDSLEHDVFSDTGRKSSAASRQQSSAGRNPSLDRHSGSSAGGTHHRHDSHEGSGSSGIRNERLLSSEIRKNRNSSTGDRVGRGSHGGSFTSYEEIRRGGAFGKKTH